MKGPCHSYGCAWRAGECEESSPSPRASANSRLGTDKGRSRPKAEIDGSSKVKVTGDPVHVDWQDTVLGIPPVRDEPVGPSQFDPPVRTEDPVLAPDVDSGRGQSCDIALTRCIWGASEQSAQLFSGMLVGGTRTGGTASRTKLTSR